MKIKNILAVIVTLLLLVLIFYKLNFSILISTFKNFNYALIPALVVLYIITLYIRGLRWKFLLQDNKKYTTLNLASIFTVGSMLNVYLPARLGDIFRAYYLGSTHSESKMKIFSSIILERLFDGIAVFIILLTAVLLSSKQAWVINLTYLTGFIFIGSVITAILIYKFNKTEDIFNYLINLSDRHVKKFSGVLVKLKGYALSFIEGFEVLSCIKYVIYILVLSLIIWGIECLIAYYIFIGFNIGIGLVAGLFVISLTSFSTMIPSTSMFLGPYQYAYILALGLFGISKSQTLAISTIHQGILMLVLSVIGIFLLLKFNISIKDIRKNNRI